MHQPPTILEGDEETEGVGQVGEGTRFPHTGAHQAPPMHDSTATASELQPREDEGTGYGHAPTLQNEIIAVGGDEPTEAPQQAQYSQPSSVEHPIIDDQAKEGAPAILQEAERELHERLDDQEGLTAIPEDGQATEESLTLDETARTTARERRSPIAEEPSATSPRADDHLPVSSAMLSIPSMLCVRLSVVHAVSSTRAAQESQRRRSSVSVPRC